MFIYNCVAFDVVFLRTVGALRFALVQVQHDSRASSVLLPFIVYAGIFSPHGM